MQYQVFEYEYIYWLDFCIEVMIESANIFVK